MNDINKEKRARILDEKRNVTSRISDTTRLIGFGLLALFYSIHVVEPDKFSKAFASDGGLWLLWTMGVSAALTIAFDCFQYIFGLLSVNAALKRPTLDYDDRSLAYRGREIMFNFRQITACVGVSMLIAIVFRF